MGQNSGFTYELQHAIANSGISQYRLSKLTGIQQSQLSRFMRGERGLSIEGIEQICKLIGARLIVEPERPKQTKGK